MLYTYRGFKVRIYLNPYIGSKTWYYETGVGKNGVGKNGEDFPTQAAALKAAKTAIDEYLEEEETELDT